MEDTPHHDAGSEAGAQRHARSEGDQRESSEPRAGAQRHARRAGLYGYAATAFQFPDETVAADLLDEEVQASVRAAAAALDVGDEVDALLEALDGTDREALESAYNDLFGLPTDDGTYPVVPYESHYTTGDAVDESQRRIATVVGLLEEFGLEVSDDFDERQDHVAVELKLLQVVAAQRAVALESGDDDAADRLERAGATVLDEHLVDFVPACAHRLGDEAASLAADSEDSGGAAHDVYAAAGGLAAALVEADDASHPDPVAAGPEVSADD